MRQVIFLPLEPLPERYAAQMLRWVTRHLGWQDIVVQPTMPTDETPTLASADFLDTARTARYRAAQITALLDMVLAGRVEKGAVVLLGDSWWPGIEQVRLVSDLQGLDLQFAGWHYAGMYDPHDLYNRTLKAWAWKWERALLDTTTLCVGSRFHRNLLPLVGNVLPLGLAWDPDEVRASTALSSVEVEYRAPRIVFPHRWCREKNPALFCKIADALHGKYPEWEWIVSSASSLPPDAKTLLPAFVQVVEHHGNKQAYYDLLASSRVVFSSARQETFGYAVHEGIALGCMPCLPAMLCYPETVIEDATYLYEPGSMVRAMERLTALMHECRPVPYDYTRQYAGSTEAFVNHVRGLK